MLGIPLVIKSDNGPPFNGSEFAEFCDFMGIRHRKLTPELPRANGQAESFMKVLAKAIRSAKAEDRDWRQVINQVLRCYTDPLLTPLSESHQLNCCSDELRQRGFRLDRVLRLER